MGKKYNKVQLEMAIRLVRTIFRFFWFNDNRDGKHFRTSSKLMIIFFITLCGQETTLVQEFDVT